MHTTPVTLDGDYVKLDPLSMDHFEQLCTVGLEPEIWRWSPTQVRASEDMRTYMETALEAQRQGTALPFATILKQTGRVVGSTRFANIDRQNRRVEIGWTWIGVHWQRSVVNTEAKYLMLSHAFRLGCIRVEFKTDSLNEKSRQALLRIGAKEEGTFRNHMIVQEGRYRHSVYFSVIDSEWPEVKTRLEEKLAATRLTGAGF